MFGLLPRGRSWRAITFIGFTGVVCKRPPRNAAHQLQRGMLFQCYTVPPGLTSRHIAGVHYHQRCTLPWAHGNGVIATSKAILRKRESRSRFRRYCFLKWPPPSTRKHDQPATNFLKLPLVPGWQLTRREIRRTNPWKNPFRFAIAPFSLRSRVSSRNSNETQCSSSEMIVKLSIRNLFIYLFSPRINRFYHVWYRHVERKRIRAVPSWTTIN